MSTAHANKSTAFNLFGKLGPAGCLISGAIVFALFYSHFMGLIAFNSTAPSLLPVPGGDSGHGDALMESALHYAAWGGLTFFAVMAVWAELGRRRCQKALQGFNSMRQLHALSWQNFERLAGALFRHQGYTVQEVGLGGADGGIDLILTRRGKRYLVQCKHYTTRNVSAMVAREMWGLAAHHRAHGVKIVTVGGFTRDAIKFSKNKDFELIDGAKLLRLLQGGG